MRLDLHCHSRCSDGTDAPEEVARLAVAAGVELLALTDHDTCDGWPAAAEAAGSVPVLRAMELTCAQAGRTVHLLLYGVAASEPLERAIADLRRRRRDRIHEICARFLRWDIHLDADAILAAAGGGTPGRPHVARALVDKGVCKSVQEAMDRFLGQGKPVDVPAPHLDPATGAALGVAAGARVALAHPHTVGHPWVVSELCRSLASAGLGGLEAVYGQYPQRVRADWTQVADDLGLVVTAGSDYHGVAVLPEVTRPVMQLDDARAARLREWLGV